MIGEFRAMADGTKCIVTAVEYSTDGRKERTCNTTPVWVCTKMTDGRHDPRCETCVQLTREEFNELKRPQRKSSKRKRSKGHGEQPDADDQPRNRKRDSTAQGAARPILEVPDDRPLIEYHVQPDEDDIHDESHDVMHDHAGRRRRAGEAPSGRRPKRTAQATNDTRSDS